MSVTALDSSPDRAAPRRDPYRLQPLKALKALGLLLKDKDDTAQVFTIMRALSGRSVPKGYAKLLRTAEGGRLAYERTELTRVLSDPSLVLHCPPGSLGAAYADFIGRENFSAEGLAEVSRLNATDIDAPHPVAWYGRRLRDIHDLWHVLTGYGADPLGEAALVAFSYAQTKSLGWVLIAVGAANSYSKLRDGQPYRRAIWEGYLRGRAARWLPAADYEALLAQPIDEVRAQMNIGPAPVYQSIPPELRHGRGRAGGHGA